MLLKEDYARCSECDNPWFRPESVYVMARDSTFDTPKPIREKVQFKCTKCGHLQYESDANLE